MKIWIQFVLVILVISAVSAQTPQPLVRNSVEKALDAFVADAELKNAAITFQVKSIKSGKVIAEYNPSMSLVPASVMKSITTATALEVLGGGYQFKTYIQYTGYKDSLGVLHGDIIVKGGGDPTLGSKYFTNDDPSLFLQDWVKAIRDSGITAINGRVIADASVYTNETLPSTWVWGDIGNGYGTAPNGISIYDNICVLRFNTGPKAGDSSYIECVQPYIPDLEFANEVRADNTTSDNAYIFGAPYSTKREVRGYLPKGKEGFEVKGSIPDPSFLAAFELNHALHEAGISVSGSATTLRLLELEGQAVASDRHLIFTQESPYLSSIVNVTNHYSVNLFAEHMVNQLGLVKYGHGHVSSGAAAIVDFWKRKGLDCDGFYVSDGSGLSRFNAVSAAQLVDIMVYMNKSKYASTFLKSLSVAGKSGTLSTLCRGTSAAGRVFAKSGTMTRVKSYAGYAKTLQNDDLAFAIVVNNYNCSTREIERKLEKLMLAMVNFH